MAIEFNCPSCGKTYRVNDAFAGKGATCKCGGRVVVPVPEWATVDLVANELDPTADATTDVPDDPYAIHASNPYVNPQAALSREQAFGGWPVTRIVVAIAGLVLASLLVSLGIWLARREPVDSNQLVVPSFKRSLQEQRGGFVTQLVPSDFKPLGPAADPPRDTVRKVYYESPAGELVAYITPKPRSGKRLPAIVWAHGGYGGINAWLWEERVPSDDQSVRSFLGKKLVVMCPSWRGENDNPGDFEFLFGEVDDLLAAGKYVANLPYVDPNRVYVAGHSNGGTLVMLAAACESPFRAAFVFGGAADFEQRVADGEYDLLPFDPERENEVVFRSPDYYAPAIRIPLLYFEGGNSNRADPAQRIARRARNEGAPVSAHIITGGSHYNILRPLKDMLVDPILADTGEEFSMGITQEQANEYCVNYWLRLKKRKKEFFDNLPEVEAMPEALRMLKAQVEEFKDKEGELGVRLKYEKGELVGFESGVIKEHTKYKSFVQDGLTFYYDPKVKRPNVGQLLDWSKEEGFSHSAQEFHDW